ncbi:MAG: hypothetical protein MUE78_06105 [Ilumatobacteraceae bacterium]|jgi:hypothetical protein|nr:hypothetical protein [Ilumatobacteraceae bacterium]
MGQLVLLVVAAAWAAVLVPPLLRSRVENRPNSSVTDFRRQLNRLQSTVPSRASASMRTAGRPLAPSPLQRPAAPGRPGQPARRTATHHQASLRHHVPPHSARAAARPSHPAHRQAHVSRHAVHPAEAMRRRRANVLFVLVITSVSTLFLAATTKDTVVLYVFALSFLALCGYVYLLAQQRQDPPRRW